MSGAYIVRMPSKFFPCLHNSTNLLATVLTLMVDSNRWCHGAHSGYTTTHMPALSSLIFAHQAGSVPRNALGTYQNFAWSTAHPMALADLRVVASGRRQSPIVNLEARWSRLKSYLAV